MSQISAKRITVNSGAISYYRTVNKSDFDILFIHGLWENKEWFRKQYNEYLLNEFSWIVPDLIGFGKSSKPKDEESYAMDVQADNLLKILDEEKVKKLVIIAHSMGGPIAISLIQKIYHQENSIIEPVCLFIMEGNFDKNDTYLSGQIASQSLNEYKRTYKDLMNKILRNPKDFAPGLYEKYGEIGHFPIWASSIDLVRISESNALLDRLLTYLNFPVYIIFGDKNRGKYSSEELLEKAGLPLIFIPQAGHLMHIENPIRFWRIIKDLICQSPI